MTKYREILRLHSQGISSRGIAESLKCSRNTIRRVLERAEEEHIGWPLPDNETDRVLEQKLFGKRTKIQRRTMPDFEHIHREIAHKGVTLSLFWNEYCKSCRMEGSRTVYQVGF
jgi:transposase